MTRRRPIQLALGLQGLALLRQWLVGDEKAIDARIREIAELLGTAGATGLNETVEIPEVDVRAGYAAWSTTYDSRPNPIISMEQRSIYPLLETAPAGHALDAASGTGRHIGFLQNRGHRVVGLDSSPEMLDAARAKHPAVPFVLGSLESLPFETASFDLVVCALALTHCPSLHVPVGELARVVRRGGRVVLSDVHPLVVALSGHAAFGAADGSRAFIRNYVHLHSAYLSTFSRTGLEVLECLEPIYTDVEIAIVQAISRIVPGTAYAAALAALPGVLIWDLARAGEAGRPELDPILGLRGQGEKLRAGAHPDEYVRRLREGWS